jgi:hypothetical protein
MSIQNLIRLSHIKNGQLPVAKATLYKWRHLRKYPDLFVRLGGAVFLDTEFLERLIEAGRGS